MNVNEDDDPELAEGPQSPQAAGNPSSPTGGAASGTLSMNQADLVLMMRQMMEVTQAASTAAQAALAATKDRKAGLGGGDMARLLPKPDVFKPATREAEHGEWSSWLWSLKQYLSALDPAFTDELTFIERHPTKDLTNEGHFRASEPLLPQVLEMERIISEYERSSGKSLDDDFKSSIFLRSVSNSMRNHLATVLTEDVTYDTLRETALHFERMNTKWDSKNLFAGDSLFSKSRGSTDGPVPMEVDALQKKGKKGGKGKGKGGKHQPQGKSGKGDKGKGKGGKQQPDAKGGKGATKAKARVASKAKARIGRMSCATRAARRVIIRVSAGTVSSKSRMLGVMQQALLHLALLVRLCRRPKALLLPRMCIVLSLSLLLRLT